MASGPGNQFEEWWNLARGRIRRYVAGLLGRRWAWEDDPDVDEIEQEVAIAAMRKAPIEGKTFTDFLKWTYVVARNKVNDFRGRASRRQQQSIGGTVEFEQALKGNAGREEDEPVYSDALEKLRRLMTGLEEKEKELLDLRFVEGLTFAEIGQRVGLSTGTAKTKIYRVIKKLRRWYGSQD